MIGPSDSSRLSEWGDIEGPSEPIVAPGDRARIRFSLLWLAASSLSRSTPLFLLDESSLNLDGPLAVATTRRPSRFLPVSLAQGGGTWPNAPPKRASFLINRGQYYPLHSCSGCFAASCNVNRSNVARRKRAGLSEPPLDHPLFARRQLEAYEAQRFLQTCRTT